MTGLFNQYLKKETEHIDERASAYWEARKAFKKAEGILEDQLKKTEDADIFIQLGDLYLAMVEYLTVEEYKKVETCLLKAIEKDPESAETYANLGVLYTQKKDFKKAVNYFEDACILDRDDLTARSKLAEACLNARSVEKDETYFKARLLEKAEDEYEKILSITPYHIESLIGLGEVYTVIAEEGDKDLYAQAIDNFTKAIKTAKSGNASKRLRKKELAAVHYSRGYARVKFYEESKTLRDESLLHEAYNDFKECIKKDHEHHKAKRALKKMEERIARFSPESVKEKWGPFIVIVLSLSTFLSSQMGFFSVRIIPIGYYILLTFGSLLFIVVGLYLPYILKLKVGGIELEKSSVDQIRTTTSLGISK